MTVDEKIQHNKKQNSAYEDISYQHAYIYIFWYNILFSFITFPCPWMQMWKTLLQVTVQGQHRTYFLPLLCGINTDTWSPLRGLHSSSSSPSHTDTAPYAPVCILHIVLSVCDCTRLNSGFNISPASFFGVNEYTDFFKKKKNKIWEVKFMHALVFAHLH